MTESLTAVIARWPHTQTSYPFQTGGCATVRTEHLPEHCRRCQVERWRDGWAEHYELRARRHEMTTCQFIVDDMLGVGIKEGE